MIITIDGPSGTGKSSAAKGLAKALGFLYFETGAMYRAVTYVCLKEKIDLQDRAQVASLLHRFSFRVEQKEGHALYFVDGEEITEKIRNTEVTRKVSEVAAIPAVREAMVPIQRRVGHQGNVVFEGRDLGTVVFPEAEVKFFLTAEPLERAKRRYKELIAKNPSLVETLSLQEILEDQEKRDEQDRTRSHSPLRPAQEAFLIDTSQLTLEEVIATLKQHVTQCR